MSLFRSAYGRVGNKDFMRGDGGVRRRIVWWCVAVGFTSGVCARAQDWPIWRGPNADGIVQAEGVRLQSLADGPRVTWRTNVGQGYSGFTVRGDRAYTMGRSGKDDTVFCLNAANGEVLWKHPIPCASGSWPGTRATPVLDGPRVYTVSREGDVLCLDAASGGVQWQVNVNREFGARSPKWGHAGSAVIEGSMVLLNAGPAGLALDKLTGKKIWSSGGGVGGYATPVVFDLEGKRTAAIFSEKEIVLVDVATGQRLWGYGWRTSYDVNAADPLYHEGRLLITSGYKRGCAMLSITPKQCAVEWESHLLQSHFSSPIFLDRYLYGIDGNAGRGDLVCAEWQTGHEKWRHNVGFGSLIAVNGKLVVLNERGTLSVVEAAPDAFKLVATADTGLAKKCWTAPVLGGGHLYCRNDKGDVVCIDVGEN